jgi:hypothetical protein
LSAHGAGALVQNLRKLLINLRQLTQSLILKQHPKEVRRCLSHSSPRQQVAQNPYLLLVSNRRIRDRFQEKWITQDHFLPGD